MTKHNQQNPLSESTTFKMSWNMNDHCQARADVAGVSKAEFIRLALEFYIDKTGALGRHREVATKDNLDRGNCPACTKASFFDNRQDRFIHLDGSDSVNCWLNIGTE